jgi:hypothetical protein
MTIYLAGHGSWDVKDASVPYARIPRGTTLDRPWVTVTA